MGEFSAKMAEMALKLIAKRGVAAKLHPFGLGNMQPDGSRPSNVAPVDTVAVLLPGDGEIIDNQRSTDSVMYLPAVDPVPKTGGHVELMTGIFSGKWQITGADVYAPEGDMIACKLLVKR